MLLPGASESRSGRHLAKARAGERGTLAKGQRESQVRSGSGAHYVGDGVDFWNKGDDAGGTWKGTELTCKTP